MKKKILFLIPILVVLLSVNNVYASVNDYLFEDLAFPNLGQFIGFNGNTGSNLSTGYQSDSIDVGETSIVKYFYLGDTPLYNDSNGISFRIGLPLNISKNEIIDYSPVFCTTVTNNWYDDWRNTTVTVGTSAQSLVGTNYYNVSSINYETKNVIYETDATTFTRCIMFKMTFTAQSSGQYLSVRIKSTTQQNLGQLSFMGFRIAKNGIDYTGYFDSLGNSIDNVGNQQEITNDKLDDLNNSITDETAPNKLGNLSDSAGWLPAGPVDSILNLPLTMFQNLSNNIGSTCTSLDLNLPYVNQNITLPCLNSIYEQIDGLSIWINSVGVIASAFILYSYLLSLYKWVDDTLTFRENNHIDNWGGI